MLIVVQNAIERHHPLHLTLIQFLGDYFYRNRSVCICAKMTFRDLQPSRSQMKPVNSGYAIFLSTVVARWKMACSVDVGVVEVTRIQLRQQKAEI